uniref:Uncharacterized protein n=1 Tax=Mycena chlorophos TaxID=658473 RepID=A0ABQ0MBH0_MYCCL|nr:predicted protein [Mycena chlorophos]
MLFYVVLFASATTTALAGPLAPRPSSPALAYYSPSYFCPSPVAGVEVTDVDYQAPLGASGSDRDPTLICSYGAARTCYFDLTNGHLLDIARHPQNVDCVDVVPGLSAATVTSSDATCGLRCTKTIADGLSTLTLTEMDTDSGGFECTYADSAGDGIICAYNVDGTPVPASASQCAASWNSCDSDTPYRRRYRREDNFTAWMKKKRGAVAVAPVPS